MSKQPRFEVVRVDSGWFARFIAANVRVYAIRYTPGTPLARRFPEPTDARFTRAEAENIRSHCANAEHMEVVDIRKSAGGRAMTTDPTLDGWLDLDDPDRPHAAPWRTIWRDVEERLTEDET